MRRSGGFSYIEVLVATSIVAIGIVPVLETLRGGLMAGDAYAERERRFDLVKRKMDQTLARTYEDLVAAAAGPQPVASWSDTEQYFSDRETYLDLAMLEGTEREWYEHNKRLVYVKRLASTYDGMGESSDPRINVDEPEGTGLLWIRVELEGSDIALETVTGP